MESSSSSLNKVELNIQQLHSKTEKLLSLESEVGDQLAEALSLLQQGERKQELRGEHAENILSERKEKLERQCGKTVVSNDNSS